jgi:hypothetical protein
MTADEPNRSRDTVAADQIPITFWLTARPFSSLDLLGAAAGGRCVP